MLYEVITALFGLLAIGEVMDLLIKGEAIATYKSSGSERSGVWSGVVATLKSPFLIFRCSTLGTIMGAIPGVGGTVAGFISYMHAKQTVITSYSIHYTKLYDLSVLVMQLVIGAMLWNTKVLRIVSWPKS